MDTGHGLTFLLIGTSNCMLKPSIAELLIKEALAKKVLQSDDPEDALKNSGTEQYAVAIVFVSHPVSALLPKLEKLNNLKTKVLLVLNSKDQFPIHYFSKYPIDGL